MYMYTLMIRTQVYFPEDLHRELFLLAKKENLAMAELVRQFVKIGVRIKRSKKSSGETLLKLASDAVKGLPKDLSNRHDEYLYGKKSPFGK